MGAAQAAAPRPRLRPCRRRPQSPGALRRRSARRCTARRTATTSPASPVTRTTASTCSSPTSRRARSPASSWRFPALRRRPRKLRNFPPTSGTTSGWSCASASASIWRVVGLCSPAGDQSPHLLLYSAQETEMLQRRGLSQRQEIARRVADAVERALACTRPEKGKEWPLIFPHAAPGPDPAQNHPRRTRLGREDARGMDRRRRANRSPGGRAPAGGVVDTFDHPQEVKPFQMELHVLRLGDMAIASEPVRAVPRLRPSDQGAQSRRADDADSTRRATACTCLPRAACRGAATASSPPSRRSAPKAARNSSQETLAAINELFPSKSL